MAFIKKLKIWFFIILFISSVLLIVNFYNNYQFKNNDLSDEIKKELYEKEKRIIYKIYKNYNIIVNIPIEISSKLSNNLYGVTTINKENKIKIYLNKRMFQESKEYMIDNVLAHEYAHAMMFVFGIKTKKYAGHTKKWQTICKNIDGLKCDRFVNSKDIVLDKVNSHYRFIK